MEDGDIISADADLAALNFSEANNFAISRSPLGHFTAFRVSQGPKLHKSAGIKQGQNPFTGCHPPTLVLGLDLVRPTHIGDDMLFALQHLLDASICCLIRCWVLGLSRLCRYGPFRCESHSFAFFLLTQVVPSYADLVNLQPVFLRSSRTNLTAPAQCESLAGRGNPTTSPMPIKPQERRDTIDA